MVKLEKGEYSTKDLEKAYKESLENKNKNRNKELRTIVNKNNNKYMYYDIVKLILQVLIISCIIILIYTFNEKYILYNYQKYIVGTLLSPEMNWVEFDNINKNVNSLSEEEIKNKLYLNQLKPIYNWFKSGIVKVLNTVWNNVK